MAVKLITQESEKDVTLLKDADVEYVSLVRHGANRMPFRVVKQQEGGEKQNMRYAIQSIILPKGGDLSLLAQTEGLEYLSEATTEHRKDFDEHFRLDQLSHKVFDAESMKLLKVGNGWLLVGALNDSEKCEGALTLSKDQVEKLASLPAAPMNAIIGDPDAAAQMAMAASFRDLFETELYAMLDIVHGALKQAAAEPKKRKTQIMSAIDAFKSFLSMGLDAIGGSPAKMEKFERQPLTSKSEGDEEMDYKSEEFVEAVGNIVGPIVKEALTTLKDELKPDEKNADGDKDKTADGAKDKTADQDKEKTEKADDAITALAATVKTLAEKVESLGDQVDANPAGESDTDTEDKEKAEKEKADKEKAEREIVNQQVNSSWSDEKINMDVFSGMLTKKKKAA
jgi:hypothetical protein